MKTIVRITTIYLIFVLALLSSCESTKLSNEEAKEIIVKALDLPARFRHDVNKKPTMGSGFELDGLRNAGLIIGSDYLDSNTPIYIEITENGKSSFIGENESAYMFKTNDVDFDQISGISINKEEKTALVRFTLKATNVTPAGRALSQTSAGFSGSKYINYSLDTPINGEITLKLFDNGWQLQTDQNKSSGELLNQILNGGR
jgi:hypothetical protein